MNFHSNHLFSVSGHYCHSTTNWKSIDNRLKVDGETTDKMMPPTEQQSQPLNPLPPANELIYKGDSRQLQQPEQLVQVHNSMRNVKHSSTTSAASEDFSNNIIKKNHSQPSAAIVTATAKQTTDRSQRQTSRQIDFKSFSDVSTVIIDSDSTTTATDNSSPILLEHLSPTLISGPATNSTTSGRGNTALAPNHRTPQSDARKLLLAYSNESDNISELDNARVDVNKKNRVDNNFDTNQPCGSSDDDNDEFDDASDEEEHFTRLNYRTHGRDEHVEILELTSTSSKAGKFLSSRNKRRTSTSSSSTGGFIVGAFLTGLKSVTSTLGILNGDSYSTPYVTHENKDLLTGDRKYSGSGGSAGADVSGGAGGSKRGLVSSINASAGRTFRGSYKYSRLGIGMAILNKLFGFLFRRSTASLLGAFLIHVTLGTIYTLSNINSYLTSYMRKHGSPTATYGSAMWISSLYSVGQGLSMILGGYIEKRFSARVACILGCAIHSLSIMATSYAIDHGTLAVLFTYGFLPGFGCGLSYMTPMSNGFGWFPNRRGLVAGTILAGFGIGTFVFNMAQTAYVNPENLSPTPGGYFTQESILDRVPHLFVFIGSIYASMQFIGCCLLFKPPNPHGGGKLPDERPILVENEITLKRAVRTREFLVLFLVFGTTNQGVLFVNSMLKEYGQIFIGNDMYLAWTGSMASIANSLGRLVWGLAIDRYSFTQCFTCITLIFGILMFIMPFEFILSSKILYLLCTLGIFGSFSGWMSTYPVHISRVFGRSNSGMIYGLIFVSQAIGGIFTAIGAHYLIDHFNRFVPFFCVTFLEVLGLVIYHVFYEPRW